MSEGRETMKRLLLILAFFLVVFCIFKWCHSGKDGASSSIIPEIEIESNIFIASAEGGICEIPIISNIEFKVMEDTAWLSAEKSENGVKLKVLPLDDIEDRVGHIFITYEQRHISRQIKIWQNKAFVDPRSVLCTNFAGALPYNLDAFGANIISYEFTDDKCAIVFDAPLSSIGTNAFWGCKDLISIIIPDGVSTIGVRAFQGCKSLSSVIIPESVVSIDIFAFSECKSLTSIIIPSSIASIGHEAFCDCTSLKSVYCKSTTPPKGSCYMFDFFKDYKEQPIGCTIYVPKSAVDAYKSAEYWSCYSDYIVGCEF